MKNERDDGIKLVRKLASMSACHDHLSTLMRPHPSLCHIRYITAILSYFASYYYVYMLLNIILYLYMCAGM